MKGIWRKFRKSGIEQSILPEAPIGTVTAFAGSAIPAGWLDMTKGDPANPAYAGPYLADDYLELYNLLGSYTVSGTLYVAVPAIKNRVVLGAYDTEYGVTGPGTATVTSGSVGQYLSYKDYAQGDSGGDDSIRLESYEAAVSAHTHPLGRSHSHGTKTIPNNTLAAFSQAHEVYRSANTIYYDTSSNETIRSLSGNSNVWTTGGAKHNLAVNSSTIDYGFEGYESDADAAPGGNHSNLQPYVDMYYIIKA